MRPIIAIIIIKSTDIVKAKRENIKKMIKLN